MPYNGSGTFVRVYNWATDKINGIPVTASRVDTEDDGFATGLTTALTKDGQTTPTANIPMGGYHLSGIGTTSAAAARTDGPAWGQVQDGGANFVAAGGSADGLTLTVAPAITAYTAGQIFWTRLTATNVTTTPTLSVSGLTAKTIVKSGGGALAASDLTSGDIAGFAYQSSLDKWMWFGPGTTGFSLGAHTWTGLQNFAAAGITFGDETLQVYDEGTWTPAITLGSGSLTYTQQTGKYRKIGTAVLCTGQIIVNVATTPSGSATMTGLPFTVFNNSANISVGGCEPAGFAATLTTTMTGPRANTNSTNAALKKYAATGGAGADPGADFANSCILSFSVFYFTS